MNLLGYDFSGIGSTVGTWAMYGVFFLLLAGLITLMVIMILVKKSQRKVIEIGMVNHRVQFYNGRIKKKDKTLRQFWSKKIGRYIPEFEQGSILSKGKQDVVVIFKDNNGLYHPAKVPSYEEIKKWYMVVHNLDLDTVKLDDKKNPLAKLKDLYLLPSPHEDLDWLSNTIAEADREFKVEHWWQSPTIAYIGVGFVCFLMVVMTQWLQKS